MKKLIFMLLVGLLTTAALADATAWNIHAKPTESWLSGSVADPAWNWMKAVDGLVGAGATTAQGESFYVDSGLTTAGTGTSWDRALRFSS